MTRPITVPTSDSRAQVFQVELVIRVFHNPSRVEVRERDRGKESQSWNPCQLSKQFAHKKIIIHGFELKIIKIQY